MVRFTRFFSAVVAVACAPLPSHSSAADPQDWKVIAKVASVGDKPAIPLTFKQDPKDVTKAEHGVVLRGPADLAARYYADPKKAADPAEQAAATEWVAKVLGVETIEWSKQMLLAISAGLTPTPHEVRVVSLRAKDGELTVTWDIVPRDGTGVSDPRALLLVPRFEGEVRFVQAEK
jgi:hypothetical protein